MRHLLEHIAIIALVVIAAPLAAQNLPSSNDTQSALAPSTKTLAVLPFEVLTDTPRVWSWPNPPSKER